MNRIRLRDAPSPLRETLVLFSVLLAVTGALTVLSQGLGLRIAMGAAGLTTMAAGMWLAGNVRGAADFYSMWAKSPGKFRVDYSGSRLGEPLAARIIGGVFVVVGILFVISGASGPL